MFWSSVVLGALAAGVASAVTVANTTDYINEVFDTSMEYLDQIYDPTAGYLWYTYYPFAAGKHETRSTVWYAAGLLRRNQGDDVDRAVRIITSVIGDQKKNVSDQWFGDYTKYPEEPTVGTAWYPESVSTYPDLHAKKPSDIQSRYTTVGTPTGEDSSARALS